MTRRRRRLLACFIFLSLSFAPPVAPRHPTTTPTILILLTVSRVWRWVAVMVVGLAVRVSFCPPTFSCRALRNALRLTPSLFPFPSPLHNNTGVFPPRTTHTSSTSPSLTRWWQRRHAGLSVGSAFWQKHAQERWIQLRGAATPKTTGPQCPPPLALAAVPHPPRQRP